MSQIFRKSLLLLLVWVLHASPGAVRAEDPVMELHLVLAFDVSASVNDVEFDLQRTGTAEAFRDSAIQEAVSRMHGGMAVSIIQWSSITQQAVGIDWRILHDEASVMRYADEVDAMPRRLPGGGTMIHAGLAFAEDMLNNAPGVARRTVIDLASNGETDDLEKMTKQRAELLTDGITINGLPIEELRNNLTQYFYDHVIGGPGAFLVTANDFDDFTRAMRIKLLREIAGPSIARGASGFDEPLQSCRPGEIEVLASRMADATEPESAIC